MFRSTLRRRHQRVALHPPSQAAAKKMESTGATSEQLEGACMRAMVLPNPKTMLQLQQVPVPQPGPCQVRVKVTVCGVCRTDLHLVSSRNAAMGPSWRQQCGGPHSNACPMKAANESLVGSAQCGPTGGQLTMCPIGHIRDISLSFAMYELSRVLFAWWFTSIALRQRLVPFSSQVCPQLYCPSFL